MSELMTHLGLNAGIPPVGAEEASLLSSAVHAWRREIHEISQPLTRLQCRLELGRMGAAQHTAEHREILGILDGALQDLVQVFASIQFLRRHLAQTEETLAGEKA